MPETIWEPNAGPQEDFLACTAFEVLTGGARGGGKSEALIMDPLAKVHVPGFRGIFFRQTYADLQQLIERTQVRYPRIFPGARWNNTDRMWVFPSGAKIIFRYLKNETDWIHYQGHEYHWMGFEELTQFTETQYLNLIPCCRSTIKEIPGAEVYIRSTTNPGGRGHNWVKARFVDQHPAGGKVFRDPETRLTRAFFPSTFRNNPQLVENDPDYVLRLNTLPEADRKAMRDGNWDAYVGSIFRFSPGIHTWSWAQFQKRTGFAEIPKDWTRFRAMDWGFAKPFSILWFAIDHQQRAYLYREWYGIKRNARGIIIPNTGVGMDAAKVGEQIARIEKEAGEWNKEDDTSAVMGVADPSCWNQGTGDHGGGPSVIEQMNRSKLIWLPGKNDRISGKHAVHDRLSYQTNEAGTRVTVAPGLIIMGDEAPHTLRTVPALEYDKHIVEDIDTTMEDHAYDAMRYFSMMRPWAPELPKLVRKGRLANAGRESHWVV